MRSKQYWKSTYSDDEYLDYLKKMEKSPTMYPDIPLYPSIFSLFKNKLSCGEHKASSQKKVQFAESKGTAELNKNDKEKNVNAQADGYINQKPKSFELHKWRTFKVSSYIVFILLAPLFFSNIHSMLCIMDTYLFYNQFASIQNLSCLPCCTQTLSRFVRLISYYLIEKYSIMCNVIWFPFRQTLPLVFSDQRLLIYCLHTIILIRIS
ncbi:hypothetical protein K7X08_034915 [Anisodus acutangulus]|uniref:Uncharacterized protein n=1 Tax=Anisodus acutangulus TaxID=402998 RepID=A0A9Q1LGL1_9SOLA|nr:hypothetical protein K7X08_034915 [Anisodus acutangulus]